MKLSVSRLFFIVFLFIYLFIYLYIYYIYRAANFMHNINIIHRSFSPTSLFPCLAGCLSFFLPCPACFLVLPISWTCPFLCLLPTSFCLCLFPMPSAYSYHYSFSFIFRFKQSAYCTF